VEENRRSWPPDRIHCLRRWPKTKTQATGSGTCLRNSGHRWLQLGQKERDRYAVGVASRRTSMAPASPQPRNSAAFQPATSRGGGHPRREELELRRAWKRQRTGNHCPQRRYLDEGRRPLPPRPRGLAQPHAAGTGTRTACQRPRGYVEQRPSEARLSGGAYQSGLFRSGKPWIRPLWIRPLWIRGAF